MRTITERRTTISLSPPSTPRLRMRPPGPAGSPRTPLDGGWWPRSTDPVAELPGLILALRAGPQADGPADDTDGPADDRGRITHVMLRVADWDSRPRRLRVDGPADTRVVRLSWFDTLPTGLLTALYADGHRVDLLTVPPYTSHAAARSALELAAHDSNHLPAPKLPAAAGRTRHTDRIGSHDRPGCDITRPLRTTGRLRTGADGRESISAGPRPMTRIARRSRPDRTLPRPGAKVG
ncbi:DUF5994 family protein [Actinomadura rugatobispora]|uniref:DUF5994 family protein n=1 Tax=Actinomadura rugatobispora TaxID=1994 RepID=A0ABW1AC46_9ACTN|nr:hypothetical protein GCM10010200_010090 [Actinomadura rugatobispora]